MSVEGSREFGDAMERGGRVQEQESVHPEDMKNAVLTLLSADAAHNSAKLKELDSWYSQGKATEDNQFGIDLSTWRKEDIGSLRDTYAAFAKRIESGETIGEVTDEIFPNARPSQEGMLRQVDRYMHLWRTIMRKKDSAIARKDYGQEAELLDKWAQIDSDLLRYASEGAPEEMLQFRGWTKEDMAEFYRHLESAFAQEDT